MDISLESSVDRAYNPVGGVLLVVALAVVCSAAVGTVLIVGSDLDATGPQATVELDTVVRDDTDGFATLVITNLHRTDSVEITAATTDGSSAIADGAQTGTAERTERRTAADSSVTSRKRVDSAAPHPVEVRLVAVAHGEETTNRVFDRTVTL